MHTKDSKETTVEVFVYNEETITFSCPHCGLEKRINAEKIKDITHWDIGALCTKCGGNFSVSFNFREYFRKKVSLKGELLSVSDPDINISSVEIEDVSVKGVGFLWKGNTAQKGNVFILRFFLDDRTGTEIEKKIQIQSIRGKKIGADFVEEEKFDVVLGKYILSK